MLLSQNAAMLEAMVEEKEACLETKVRRYQEEGIGW